MLTNADDFLEGAYDDETNLRRVHSSAPQELPRILTSATYRELPADEHNLVVRAK